MEQWNFHTAESIYGTIGFGGSKMYQEQEWFFQGFKEAFKL